MKSRRFDGSPITITRSSGPKNTARTCRRRSTRRRTGERFTCTRFAPCPGISTSISTRPARSRPPRACTPDRPRPAGPAARSRRAAASRKNRKAIPSSRFVLPSPLGPTNDHAVAERPPGASRRGCGSPGARPSRAATRGQPTGVGRRTGITRYVNSSDSPRTIPASARRAPRGARTRRSPPTARPRGSRG